MERKYRKSFWPIPALMATIGAYLFVIVIILVFFYFFKFHVTLVMREQYLWNKLQEVPMDLMSMNLDGELLVSKVNKVYYADESVREGLEQDLRDRIDNIVSKQILYYFEGTEYPFEADIHIGDISVAMCLEGCYCRKESLLEGGGYRCSDECPEETRGKDCRAAGIIGLRKPDHSKCLPYAARTEYSAEFPFPLTFNATDKFVEELSYKIIETK